MAKTLREAFDIVAAKMPMEDITLKRRLERGYDIVLSTGYRVKRVDTSDMADKLYKVYRVNTSLLEDSSATYYVDENSCTCPDFGTARAGLCKHRFAIMLMEEMDR